MTLQKQLASLHAISKSLAASNPLDTTLNAILDCAVEPVGTDTAAIVLLDEKGKPLSIQCSGGPDQPGADGIPDKVAEHLAGHVARTGKTMVAGDLAEKPGGDLLFAVDQGWLALAGIPLSVDGEIAGALDVRSRTNPKAFDKENIGFLEALAGLAATAIRNDRLKERLNRLREELDAEASEQASELKRKISEHKRQEKKLRHERDLLNAAINSLPDLIYVKDGQARFIIGNQTLARVMGAKAPEELLGKTDFDFYPEDLAKQYFQDDMNVVESGKALINREEPNIDQETGRKQWLLTSKIPFTDEDGQFIGLVGVGRDITQRKLAQEALRRSNRELGALNEMGGLFQTCRSEDESRSVVAYVCGRLFPQDHGCLFMAGPRRQSLDHVIHWGGENQACPPLIAGKCPAFAQQGHQSLTQEAANCECGRISGATCGMFVCHTIGGPENPVGVLRLWTGNNGLGFTEEERNRNIESRQHLVKRVSDYYSLFLGNLRLRETLRLESIRDPLTGLYNRRHMEASLERERHRAVREGTSLGIIMADIDHFKNINDQFGHDAGDLILQALGEFLSDNVRGEDIACRYGGEEFLLILAGAPRESVIKRAEDMRIRISNLGVDLSGHITHFTVSMGVAMLEPDEEDVRQVVTRADRALYSAKKQGRNRVVMAGPDQDEPVPPDPACG